MRASAIAALCLLGTSLALVAGLLLALNNPPNCGEKFGGPYPKNGKFADKVLEQKQADFARYKGLELNLSRTIVLDSLNDFKDHITKNRAAPNRKRQQKYNYVITEECAILVAGWSGDGDLSQIGSVVACAGGREKFLPPKPGNMIDWAAEEPYGRALATPHAPQRSPCWLDADREIGILDAISKHFMLAQGEGATIDSFDAEKWAKARVAYAGEILVNLETCTYIVTENSGTYQPLGKYRLQVNEWVARELHGVMGTPVLPNPVPGC